MSMATAASRSLPGASVAQTMAEFIELSDSDELSLDEVRARFLQRAEQVGVPYSETAALLSVSIPTIRSWVARGLLVEAEGLPVHAVTAASVGGALAALNRLDSSKPRQEVLLQLAEEIRNRDLLTHARRVSEGAAHGAFLEVTDEELAEL